MSSVAFLAHLPDPFGIGSPRFVLLNQAEAYNEFSVEQLSSYNEMVITYDAWVVVDALRRAQKSPPRQLIDVGDALRLRSGLSKDQGGEKEWDVWRAMKPYIANDSARDTIYALIQTQRKQPDPHESLRLLKITCQALKDLWDWLQVELRDIGEYERFQAIEIPIQQVFWHRQYRGIAVDNEHASQLLDAVKNEKYSAFREVASMLRFNPSGLRFSNVGRFLLNTDASHLAEFSDTHSLQEYFRMAQHASRFASAFLQYIRASDDLSILKRICGGTSRVYPVFHPLGTVSGRILVSEPRLQELRKKYRSILAADESKSLVYLDYSQFEPGILASLAGDDSLIQRYNESDLYTSLSNALFGNGSQRSLCKRIFLGFCFGMKRQNIAKLLAGANATEKKLSEYATIVGQFFDAFPRLDEYKSSLENRLLQDGYISSIFGNRRRRDKGGNLSHKERRWAVSQMVQGTASVIFKQSIIGLASEFGSDSILLPMHDAVLLQVNGSDEDRRRAQDTAIRIMEDAFTKWIGNVKPKVVVATFSGE